MKISFITTVFNEATNINLLIDSIFNQSFLPDEIIIVDGGSEDNTIKLTTERIKKDKLRIKLFVKKGNRSVGRNEAIKNSTGDIVLCADAGCILDKDWVKNIVKPFKDKKVDVVAGYYDSKPKSVFEKCLIPYVFVMPDKVDPKKFLPATRSMAFKKSVWERLGGFNEQLSHNEDYDFAKRLNKMNFKIAFAKDAVVSWIPPSSLIRAFIMFFRFAYGDAEAGIYRPKALFIIFRYLLGLLLLLFTIFSHSLFLSILLFVLFVNYILWAILKNYYYVKNPLAIFFLPSLQLLSDFAVIIGTILGSIKRIGK